MLLLQIADSDTGWLPQQALQTTDSGTHTKPLNLESGNRLFDQGTVINRSTRRAGERIDLPEIDDSPVGQSTETPRFGISINALSDIALPRHN